MKLLKRNGSLLNEMPVLFDDLFNRDLFNWGNLNFSDTNTTIPAVNIKETAGSYEVQVAAPGMTKKDFKVELDGNSLTISSERSNEKNLVINLSKGLLFCKKTWWILTKSRRNTRMAYCIFSYRKKRKQNKSHQD